MKRFKKLVSERRLNEKRLLAIEKGQIAFQFLTG